MPCSSIRSTFFLLQIDEEYDSIKEKRIPQSCLRKKRFRFSGLCLLFLLTKRFDVVIIMGAATSSVAQPPAGRGSSDICPGCFALLVRNVGNNHSTASWPKNMFNVRNKDDSRVNMVAACLCIHELLYPTADT